MPKQTYAIEFRYPEGTVYAGEYKQGLGWAPTLATAILWDNADTAQRVLQNGYGEENRKWGYVVPVVTTPA